MRPTFQGSIVALFSVSMVLPGVALWGRFSSDPRRAWGEGALETGLHRVVNWVQHRPKTVGVIAVALLALNLASVFWRARATRQWLGPVLSSAGTAAMLLKLWLDLPVAPLGIGLVISLGVLAIALGVMGIQVYLSSRVAGQLRATALGGYNAFLSAGLGLGPLLAGTVSDARGFEVGFASAGLAGVLVAVVAGGIAITARGRGR